MVGPLHHFLTWLYKWPSFEQFWLYGTWTAAWWSSDQTWRFAEVVLRRGYRVTLLSFMVASN